MDDEKKLKQRRVTVSLTESAYAWLCSRAKETGRGLGALVRAAVDAARADAARKEED